MVGKKEEFIKLAEKRGMTTEEAIKYFKILDNPDQISVDKISEDFKKEDLPYFTQDKSPKFVPLWLAKDLCLEHHFVTHEQTKELYVYNEGIYEPRGEVVVRNKAQKRLGRFTKSHYINETVDCIKRDTFTHPDKFNNPEEGIVVKNGLLDLETRELKEPSPEYIHLSRIPINYDPEADCPKIKKFISEIVNGDDIKLVQEMFGYCLLKDYPIAKAFMLLGSGANGKSTLIDLLELFLGEDNIATPSLQDLLDNRFAKVELYGKLANLHADLSNKKLESTGTFKMLTGGDTVRGEKKYQGAIKFKNYAKLIYSANELPKTDDRTTAFWRRWVVIDFPNEFPEGGNGTDESLPHSIATEEELSGLLNWALDGLDRVLEGGHFSHTKTRNEIEKKWIMKTDSLRAFLDMACEIQEGSYTLKEDLYKVYKHFCAENNIFTVKKGQVTKRLPSIIPQTELFRPKVGDKQIRAWRNLTIKPGFIKEVDYRQDIQGVRKTFNSPNDISDKNIYKKGSLNSLDMLSMEEKIRKSLEKNPKCYFKLEDDVLKKADNDKKEDFAANFNKVFSDMKNKGEIMLTPEGKYSLT